MSNIIDSIQLSGVTYAIQGSGGGKAIEAGRGISVTTGETADTVSFNLPISAGTGTNSIAEGYHATADGNYSHAEGFYALVTGNYSHAEGNGTVAYNDSEHASGQHNVSSKASTTFGNSGNTLFSVGNGTAYNARHNAFEIRQNGDIYLSSGGTDIKLQDHLGSGGNPTVELTQAEYDALVTAGTVSPTTYYIITDATPADLSQYWTSAQTQSAITEATSGKVNTSSVVSSVTSASTDSEIPTAKAVFDAIPTGGTGGGKAISAGTNISVTTGETADTINCTLPISAGTNVLGVVANAIKMGERTTASSVCSFAMGTSTLAKGYRSFAGGVASRAMAETTFAYGTYVDSSQFNETAFGKYNVSNKANNTWGDSGNTLFSVGNGTANNARHNAFEIRQNGDIYCSDGTNDVKLQDTITATAANTTALGGLKLVKLTQSAYDALVQAGTVDPNTLYIIKD